MDIVAVFLGISKVHPEFWDYIEGPALRARCILSSRTWYFAEFEIIRSYRVEYWQAWADFEAWDYLYEAQERDAAEDREYMLDLLEEESSEREPSLPSWYDPSEVGSG